MQGKCPQCHRPWHHLDGFIVSSHAHTLMSMPQLVFVRTYQNRPPTPSWTVFKHKSSEWFKIHICLFILFPGWESKTLEPCCAQKSRSLGSSCPMPILCYSDLCVKVSFSVTLSPLEWDFYRSLSACIQNQKQLWNQTLFTHRKKNSGRSSKCWETLKTTTTKHFYLSSCVSFFFPQICGFPPIGRPAWVPSSTWDFMDRKVRCQAWLGCWQTRGLYGCHVFAFWELPPYLQQCCCGSLREFWTL